MLEIRRLNEKARDLQERAREVLERAEAEDRDLTREEQNKFDATIKEAEAAVQRRDNLKAVEEVEKAELVERCRQERQAVRGAYPVDLTDEEKRTHCLGLWFQGVWRKNKDLQARALHNLGCTEYEVRAAMQEDTPSEGGYMIPTPLAKVVLYVMKDYGIMRQIAKVLPMESKTLSVPDVATKPSVTIVAEEGTVQESEPVLGVNTLTAKKLISYALVSNELRDDATVDVGTLLLTLFGESIAGLEDQQALEGDGTGNNFTGLATALTGGSEVSAASATNLDPFIAAMGIVGAQSASAVRNGSWVFHPLAWMTVQQLKSSTAGEYFLNPQPAKAAPLTLLGRPVYLSDQIAVTSATPDTTSGYFGDFSQGMLVGVRQNPFVFVNPYTNATTWQTSIYVGERVAINVALPDVFVEITSIDSDVAA